MDEEFSEIESDANDDDDAKSKTNNPPVLQPADQEMRPEVRNDSPPRLEGETSDDGSDEEREDEPEAEPEDELGQFPSCYPAQPPLVETLPRVEYPVDTPQSTPSQRNMEFDRMVQNNFVPFTKGLKGEAYRRRTNYEHQKIMGYVYPKNDIFLQIHNL